MANNFTHIRRALMAAGFLLVAQPSFAANTLTFNGFADGSVDVNIAAVPPAIVTHDNVGAYATSVNGGASFDTFCVDVWQYLSFNTPYSLGAGQVYQYQSDLTGYVTDGGHGATLTSTVLNNLSSLYDEVESTGGYAGNNIKSAALQVAIWEVAYDTGTAGGYNLSSGNFYSAIGSQSRSYSDTEAVNQATAWLSGLGSYSDNAYTVFGYTSSTKQDVIGFTPTIPVPEPETYAMLLAGLGLMGFIARRRRAGRAIM